VKAFVSPQVNGKPKNEILFFFQSCPLFSTEVAMNSRPPKAFPFGSRSI
jgi:hypothetical protein